MSNKDKSIVVEGETYHNGQELMFSIKDRVMPGVLSIPFQRGYLTTTAYVCQNKIEGAKCEERFGYKYSWMFWLYPSFSGLANNVKILGTIGKVTVEAVKEYILVLTSSSEYSVIKQIPILDKGILVDIEEKAILRLNYRGYPHCCGASVITIHNIPRDIRVTEVAKILNNSDLNKKLFRMNSEGKLDVGSFKPLTLLSINRGRGYNLLSKWVTNRGFTEYPTKSSTQLFYRTNPDHKR